MTRTLAGKAMLTCPDCGAPVREDLLPDHATRCPSRVRASQPQTTTRVAASPPAASQQPQAGKDNRLVVCPYCGKQIALRRLERHRQVCQSPAKPISQDAQPTKVKAKPASPPSQPRPATHGSAGTADEHIVCPACERPFARNYYERHRQVCRGRPQPEAQPNAAKRISGKPVAAIPPARRLSGLDDHHGPTTRDGYPIDTCWDCGQRICLVPEGDTVRVFDIVQKRKSALPHACSGSVSDARRTKLVYVDPMAGSVAPSDKRNRRRKL